MNTSVYTVMPVLRKTLIKVITAVKERPSQAAVSFSDCVCAFLQQVDTDEPVFTMTEHLFPY